MKVSLRNNNANDIIYKIIFMPGIMTRKVFVIMCVDYSFQRGSDA
jgi:hypothetical protein